MAGKTKKINIKMVIDTEINNAKNQIDKLVQGISQIQGPKKVTKSFEDITSKLGTLKKSLQDIQDFKITDKNFSQFEKKINKLPQTLKKLETSLEKIKQSNQELFTTTVSKKNNLLQQLNNLVGGTFNSKLTGKEALGADATENQLRQYKTLKSEFTKVNNQLNAIASTDSEINRLSQAFNSLNSSVSVGEKGLDEVRRQLNQIEAQKASDSINSLTARFLSFTAVVYVGRQALNQFRTTLTSLDEDLTAIAAVTGKTREQMWEMVDTYNEMAFELGTTTQQIAQASKLYYQQGRTQSEVTELVKQTAILATTAEIDYTTATDYLTAAINGYNIAADEAYKVTDSWSALAAASAVDVNELAVAMSKVASLAAASGLELETASAFLSKMLETTREAPENLGTALKTIISRFQDLKMSEEELEDGVNANDVEKALKSAGVELRDSIGQFRDFDDVLMDLSKVWDGLSVNTQKYIATIAAGSRQQSRFIALVSDYERNLELIDIAQDSAGASTAQFNIFLTGLQASFNRLTSAWEGFYTSFNQGPSLISWTIDLMANLLNTLADFGPLSTTVVFGLNAVILKLVASAAAYKLSTVAIEEERNAKIQAIITNNALSESLKAQTIALVESATATKTSAVSWLANAKNLLATASPYIAIGALVVGLTAGIISLATAQERHIKKLKEETAALQAQANQINQSIRTLKSLEEQYEKAVASGEDLSLMQETLIDQFPELAGKIDLVTDSVAKVREEFKKYEKEQSKLSAQSALQALDSELELEIAQFNQLADQSRKVKQRTKYVSPENKVAVGTETIVYYEYDGKIFDTKKELIDYLKNTELDLDYSQIVNVTNYLTFDYENLSSGVQAAVSDFVKDNFSEIIDSEGNIKQESFKIVDEIVEKTEQASKEIQENLSNSLLKNKSAEEIEKYANNLIEKYYNSNYDINNEELFLLQSIFGTEEQWEEYSRGLSDTVEGLIKSFTSYTSIFGDNEGVKKALEDLGTKSISSLGVSGTQSLLQLLEEADNAQQWNEIYNGALQLAESFSVLGDAAQGLDISDILSATEDADTASEMAKQLLSLAKNTELTAEETNALAEAYAYLLSYIDNATTAFTDIDNITSNFYELQEEAADAIDATAGVAGDKFNELVQEANSYGLSLKFVVNENRKYVISEESMLQLLEAKKQALLEELDIQIAHEEAVLANMKASQLENETTSEKVEATNTATKSASLYAIALGTVAKVMSFIMGEDASFVDFLIQQAQSFNKAADSITYDTEVTDEQIAAQETLVEALKAQREGLATLTPTIKDNSDATGDNTDALEDQKKALEKSKDALEKQKQALEDARDAAKDYANTLADAIKNRLEKELEKAESAVENYYDALNQALEELIDNATDELDKLQQAAEEAQDLAEENADALQEQADLVIDFYDKQIEAIQAKIDASQEEADALERLQKLQEARDAYEQAKQKTRLVLIEGAGWRFRTDKDALTEAGESLATTETENQNELLEQQIEALENIKAKWEEIAENIGKATSELEKTANFQVFLESRSPDQLDDLYNQFAGSVGQNNALFENALQAQNKYEEQNNANAEGTLAWQISQWQQAQEQAELDQNQFDILTDPNAKAVEELKQQLLQQLGSASGESIQNVLSNGLQITIENAEKVNAINDTLDALEELLNKMDMTSEEIAEYNNIQNMVGQASLEALLEGGSVYNQLEDEINEIVYLNDQILIIEGQISVLQGQIDTLNNNINSVKDTINDGVTTTGEYITTAADDIVDAIGNIKVEVNVPKVIGTSPFDRINFAGAAEVGGVQDEGEYLRVHGTKNRPELVLNNSQAAGLFKFIDSLTRMPSILASLPSLAKNESSQTINNEEGLSFQNCVFEIKTDSDNLEGLISDLKRQVPFK